MVPAGHFPRKCEQLVEEGVRVLMVVDADAPGRMRQARAEGVTIPGADDLWVLRCAGVEEVVRLVGVREIPSVDALKIFPAYLDAAGRLATYVDRWSAGQ